MNPDTICAIATAPGTGGIAVIRISGPEAVEICNKIVTLKAGSKTLSDIPSQNARFGQIMNDGELLDEVVVTIFRAPRSYTGEDTVEISIHGSPYIRQQLLLILVANGCRLAQAGEFTRRAFLSGKLDLSQAEAVADLLSASTAGMHRMSISQMRGGFSRELSNLRARLLDLASLIELELDFGEEDVLFADRSQLQQLAQEIEALVRRLTESFALGNAIKNGLPVAIAGETNVGKSTLLNALLNEDRAIVSDIHGTTRDTIEDTTVISGITFRFIDAAGLRQTDDATENLGIERALSKLEQAAIILLVLDASRPAPGRHFIDTLRPRLSGKKIIKVYNKSDLSAAAQSPDPFPDLPAVGIRISAREGQNIDALRQLLVEAAALPEVRPEDTIVVNARHHEALTNAHSAILRVIEGLSGGLSGDYLSQDVRECAHYIGEITGEITTDEILGNIFSRFCIGK